MLGAKEPVGVMGLCGITAFAESVVMNVEMLAIEVRNFCSLIGCGRISSNPSKRSFAAES